MPQPTCVVLALVAEDVVLRRDHQSGGQTAQIDCPAWRGVWVPAVVQLFDVVFPVPGHLGPGQEVPLGALAVRRVVQIVVGDRIDQHLEGSAVRHDLAPSGK